MSKSDDWSDEPSVLALSYVPPEAIYRVEPLPGHQDAIRMIYESRATDDPAHARSLLRAAAEVELFLLPKVRELQARVWVAETAARAALEGGEDALLERSVREGIEGLEPDDSRYWYLTRLRALGMALQPLDLPDRRAIDWLQLNREREDLVDLAFDYGGQLLEFSFNDALDEVKVALQEPGRLRLELPMFPKAAEVLEAISTRALSADGT